MVGNEASSKGVDTPITSRNEDYFTLHFFIQSFYHAESCGIICMGWVYVSVMLVGVVGVLWYVGCVCWYVLWCVGLYAINCSLSIESHNH